MGKRVKNATEILLNLFQKWLVTVIRIARGQQERKCEIKIIESNAKILPEPSNLTHSTTITKEQLVPSFLLARNWKIRILEDEVQYIILLPSVFAFRGECLKVRLCRYDLFNSGREHLPGVMERPVISKEKHAH